MTRHRTFRELLGSADCDALALAFRYPSPGQDDRLRDATGSVLTGTARRAFARFVTTVTTMPRADWEELYTRTLDLSPLVAPYVGFAVWGETYHRGAFLADLVRAQADAGITHDGELPDHLDPVLRYLAAVDEPLPAVVGALPVASDRLHQTLKSIERGNPYVDLLHALRLAAAPLADIAPPPHVTSAQTLASLPVLGG